MGARGSGECEPCRQLMEDGAMRMKGLVGFMDLDFYRGKLSFSSFLNKALLAFTPLANDLGFPTTPSNFLVAAWRVARSSNAYRIWPIRESGTTTLALAMRRGSSDSAFQP